MIRARQWKKSENVEINLNKAREAEWRKTGSNIAISSTAPDNNNAAISSRKITKTARDKKSYNIDNKTELQRKYIVHEMPIKST